MKPVIYWFRQDLRLHDNPALTALCDKGVPLILLYIFCEDTQQDWSMGKAQRWWLHRSLEKLDQSLDGHLILRRGNPQQILDDLIKTTGATALYWNRCYEPHSIQRDRLIKENVKAQGLDVCSFNSHLLFEPWTIKNLKGDPYKVFSQFWKTCLKSPAPGGLLERPKDILFHQNVLSESLDSWSLLPDQPNWALGFEPHWQPGETGAYKTAQVFMENGLKGYKDNRNYPDQSSTSRLSPHLHFGEISPRWLWHQVHAHGTSQDHDHFLSELGWREFSYHLLYHFPTLPTESFRQEFDDFPWDSEAKHLKKWQQGLTGYPIVDAGMRQLWATGWMHNRVRMIVASFLIKDLFIDWRQGQAWFWDTLLDADLANNAASWQWVAGSGADAAPYFRVFNPTLQGEKFDPQGDYVRTWVPELKALPDAWIHHPYDAPALVLKEANVALGHTYPHPLVDHSHARTRALDAYKILRGAEASAP